MIGFFVALLVVTLQLSFVYSGMWFVAREQAVNMYRHAVTRSRTAHPDVYPMIHRLATSRGQGPPVILHVSRSLDYNEAIRNHDRYGDG